MSDRSLEEMLSEWEKVASLATPGPWAKRVSKDMFTSVCFGDGTTHPAEFIWQKSCVVPEVRGDDGAYIALANPSFAKELIAAVRSRLSPVQGEELPPIDVTDDELEQAEEFAASCTDFRSELVVERAECDCRTRQLREACAEIGRLKGKLETSEHWKKCFRTRMFAMKSSDNSSHTTACTIWGDDGQGNTLEKYAQPLPCNCGALANYERSRADAAELALSASRADALKEAFEAVRSQKVENTGGYMTRAQVNVGLNRAEQAILAIGGGKDQPSKNDQQPPAQIS